MRKVKTFGPEIKFIELEDKINEFGENNKIISVSLDQIFSSYSGSIEHSAIIVYESEVDFFAVNNKNVDFISGQEIKSGPEIKETKKDIEPIPTESEVEQSIKDFKTEKNKKKNKKKGKK